MKGACCMKFPRQILCRIIFAVYAVYPGLSLIALCFGYRVTLFHNVIASALFALLSILLTDRLLRADTEGITKSERFFFGLLPPLSIINWILYSFGAESPWLIVSMLICLICSLIVSTKFLKFMAIKILGILLSVLLVFPLSFISLFSGFGKTTVRKTVPAPNGRYYAEVMESDQGALGGDTIVNVHKGRKLNLLVLSFEKRPETIYVGHWLEYTNMSITWKDNTCLIINSTEYPVS